MNLILVQPGDFVAPRRVVLDGRRAEHVRQVHRAAVGDRLRVGTIGGTIGVALVRAIEVDRVELELDPDRGEVRPPPSLDVILCVAMCRPPTLTKVLGQATAMGIKRFVLFHARRVEKSYWQSSALEPDAVELQLRLGLEQARDTIMPSLERHERFRPFAEDALPRLASSGRPLIVAHPAARTPTVVGSAGGVASPPCVLVVGPEGGLVDFEVERLAAVGATFVDLGPRILRVETAVVTALARLAGPLHLHRPA